MSTPARNQSIPQLNMPARKHVFVSSRAVRVPLRQTGEIQQPSHPSAQATSVNRRHIPSAAVKKTVNIDNATPSLPLPMPPELPEAMTILLPLASTIDPPHTKGRHQPRINMPHPHSFSLQT